MSVPARVPWSTDIRYPTLDTECGVCHSHGPRKLAWDRLRFICIDSQTCLSTMKERRPVELAEIRARARALDLVEAPTPVAPARASNGIQTLGPCRKCGCVWTKPASRGRPAVVCVTCRNGPDLSHLRQNAVPAGARPPDTATSLPVSIAEVMAVHSKAGGSRS